MTTTQKTTARRIGPEDTRRAARPAEARAGNQRDRMLAAFIAAGERGLTDFEAADELGISLNSVRPRRVELRERGLIRDSGRTRKAPSGHRAHVWMAVTAAGRLPTSDLRAEAKEGQKAARGDRKSGNAKSVVAKCPQAMSEKTRDQSRDKIGDGPAPKPIDSMDRPPVFHWRRPPATRRGCCPRCGYREYRDVPIHGGRSIRRDCARCERFLCFPVWYGQPAETETPD